jgi:hypothetical protein
VLVEGGILPISTPIAPKKETKSEKDADQRLVNAK